MVTGHLREKNGIYQMVLNYKDDQGKYQTKSISTGLPVKGNKKRAEDMLQAERKKFEQKPENDSKDILFSDYLLSWLDMMKNSVEITTYGSYFYVVKNHIVPYFKEKEHCPRRDIIEAKRRVRIDPRQIKAYHRV